ncbi:hypothetical protein SAMN04488107_1600 [Geodermatophilus saharensis]|uniref:Uncharacterized protein n=2 Tax=Geodermatophilus saharensis TaxID=1137994 RepID=A0A239C4F1_9ACTN|nr:hypothetical protein SAMN04488107_1600 [Geodermatophilus saharensis]
MTEPPPLLDPARTARELDARLTSLEAELRSWGEATTGPDGPLRRHHTQMAALAGTLAVAVTDVRTSLDRIGRALSLLDRAAGLDRRILDLHRLWGFFRDKLSLRFVPWLRDSLVTADDLAWECYSPVQAFLPAEQRREPPLTYFTGGASPFLMPRGTLLVVEPLPDGGLREPDFAEAVRAVPVPLIGLPWFHAFHLPDAPLLAHEAGHAVENDLGLATQVRSLIAGAVPDARRAAWSAWSSEIFADVYGVLGCGSGFCRALSALLATHPRGMAGDLREEADWGSYPTRTLRVLIAAAVLEEVGIVPAAGSVTEQWRQVYADRPHTDFEDDVEVVVRALLTGPYDALGGAGLGDVLPYQQEDENAVAAAAEELDSGLSPSARQVRHVAAAARLAYDRNPCAYARNETTLVALNWIGQMPSVAERDEQEPPPEPSRGPRNDLAGHRLAALLGAAADARERGDGDVPA